MSSNLGVRTNTLKNNTHPPTTILYNTFWNAKYKNIQDEEMGFSNQSGYKSKLTLENFVEKSPALSLMVKTAHLKKNPKILEKMVIKEEHQGRKLKSQHENNTLQSQNFSNQYEKQQPLYEYLYDLQKSAISQRQASDTALMAKSFAFSKAANKPEVALNDDAITDIESFSYANNNSYAQLCPICEAPLEQKLFRQHLDNHYPRDSPVCPVIECGRRFAHPNSVRNHMRIKHTQQWAKMKVMRSSAAPLPSGMAFVNKCETN